MLNSLKANGMDKNTIIVFNADHGELGGNHQMRGKGNSAYRQQNHLPLMIVHPAYPGGNTCAAVTSQIDLAPTLLALSGADPAALAKASGDLRGRSYAGLLSTPDKATPNSLRPASLFNYNMLSFQDAHWARKMELYMRKLEDAPDREAQGADQSRTRFPRPLRHPQRLRRPLPLQPLFLAARLQHADDLRGANRQERPGTLRPQENPRRSTTSRRTRRPTAISSWR